LLKSKIHEQRVCALRILDKKFKIADEEEKENILILFTKYKMRE